MMKESSKWIVVICRDNHRKWRLDGNRPLLFDESDCQTSWL